MGMPPDAVGRMTPWQFMACVDGYGRANGWQRSSGRGMSLARLRELGIE